MLWSFQSPIVLNSNSVSWILSLFRQKKLFHSWKKVYLRQRKKRKKRKITLRTLNHFHRRTEEKMTTQRPCRFSFWLNVCSIEGIKHRQRHRGYSNYFDGCRFANRHTGCVLRLSIYFTPYFDSLIYIEFIRFQPH